MGRYGRNGRPYLRKAREVAKSGPCWLCGKPIDPNLKWPHPYSGSADHVVSVASGGAALGEMRPAHLIGNMRRQEGNGVEPPGGWCAPPKPRKPTKLAPRHSQDW